MDAKTDTLAKLRQIAFAHGTDCDGGYALVRGIRDWAATLDQVSKELLWIVLVDLVIQQDAALWGVALEVLVQENPRQAAEKLSCLLELRGRREEWTDQVVLALLRLRYRPAAARCIDHIQSALLVKRRSILPLLAALCQVDRETCINLASLYFAQTLVSDRDSEEHRGYIPSFVRNFLEVDDGLLYALVERTKKIDTSSATRLVRMIESYLEQPFFIREIGEAAVARLRDKILAA
jgi:hypothetical protein